MMVVARRIAEHALCAACVVALLPACGGEGESRSGTAGPNVLLVSLDSVRRDLVGCYGGGSPHAPGLSPSPHLDRLAAEGVRMERAYSTTSWTLPAHLSLLSGTPELVHGVDSDRDRLAPDLPLLAEILSGAGYRTAGFFSGPYLEPIFGMGRGFERYEACYGERLSAAAPAHTGEAAYDPKPPSGVVELLSHRDRSSRHVTDAALAELERAAEDERPFFLFAHYFDPHYDYVPPAPYDKLYDPDYGGKLDGTEFLSNPALSVPDPQSPGGRRRVASERDMQHVRALYSGELAWTDAQLGRLLERLEQLDLERDTLVIVVSDHGDEFFEHGGLGHRRTLNDEVLAVPMLLRFPGRLEAGSTRAALVSLVDVGPTVLELVGMGARATEMLGRSFAPSLAGPQAGSRTRSQDAGVMGRLVTQAPTRFRLGGQLHDGVLVTVRESFRIADLVLHRVRRWAESSSDLPAEVQAEFDALQVQAHSAESLTWSSLEEPAGARRGGSSDFTEPQALAALEAFRAEYVRLLDARRAGGGAREDVGFRAQLEALGYTGSVELQGGRLILPPPGESILHPDTTE